MAAKKIALFIDADNISSRFGKQIIETLERHGEIFIRRIYGNWEKPSLHGWNDCIRDLALRPVQQTDFVSGKNATDMSLTIDAMDVLHCDDAEIFALVTNDSDFTPLVIRLREGGMKIIGIGNANASNAFRAACNDFIDLSTFDEVMPAQSPTVTENISSSTVKPTVQDKNQLVQLSLFDAENNVEPSPPVTSNPKVISLDERKLQSDRDKKIQLMHDALQDSARLNANDDGFSSLNHARQYLRNRNFDFTVQDFGYGQLRDFIAAYPKLYETRQDDNGQNFCYRCRANNVKPASVNNDKLRRMHEVLREATAAYADTDGFADLSYIGGYISKKNLGFSVKDLGYGQLKDFIAAFPNLYELRQCDKKNFLHCRADESKPAESKRLQQLHQILRETAKDNHDKNGFVDLNCAGQNIHDKKFNMKGLGYGSLSKFISAFPKIYEVKKVGNIVRYRCRC